MTRTFVLAHEDARQRACAAVADAPAGYVVTVREPARNLEQNALMWVWLTAFSRRLLWPVNGQMVKLEPGEWKDILTAAFRQEVPRIAMGLSGGMVMLGCSTRAMSKREFSGFADFIGATAADRGVDLSEPGPEMESLETME